MLSAIPELYLSIRSLAQHPTFVFVSIFFSNYETALNLGVSDFSFEPKFDQFFYSLSGVDSDLLVFNSYLLHSHKRTQSPAPLSLKESV